MQYIHVFTHCTCTNVCGIRVKTRIFKEDKVGVMAHCTGLKIVLSRAWQLGITKFFRLYMAIINLVRRVPHFAAFPEQERRLWLDLVPWGPL